MSYEVLALDVAGTLISNNVIGPPVARPGLFEFLTFCEEFPIRTVLFTGLTNGDVKRVIEELLLQEEVPSSFAQIENVLWSGRYKNLEYVSNVNADQVLIVDDTESAIHPEQKHQWIPIRRYNHYYLPEDEEFLRIIPIIQEKFS